MVKHTRITILCFIVATSLVSGCSGSKELESQNREQARVISELKNEVARLQSEASELRASRDELARVNSSLQGQVKGKSAGTQGLIK